jgi:cytoskeletal protein CcmA (bactofilin family)
MNKLKGNESGQVLILVMLLLLVSGLLLPPLLSLSVTGISAGQMYERRTLELHSAEAGIEFAMWKIKNDLPDEFPHSFQLPEDVNSKAVTVTITKIGQAYRITSTAMTDSNSTTTVESYVQPVYSLLDFAAAALDGDITISGNTIIESYPDPNRTHVYADGDILLQGKVEVHGDVTATGRVTMTGQSSVTGTITANAPPIEIGELDTSAYLHEADGGTPIYGDLSITESCTLGPTHIYGNLSIASSAVVTLTGSVWVGGNITMSGSGHVEGTSTIVAVGNIEVTGGGTFEPEDLPFFISTTGNIRTAGNQQVFAVLYAPNGNVIVSGGAGIFGGVIGKAAIIETSSTFCYELELAERHGGHGALKVLTWKIIN